jgi:hypothetical protein
MQADSSEIGGIGGFDKIAGETMYEYMASDPQMVAPEMASSPQMASPEMASVTTPQVEMYMKSPYSEF